MERSTLITIQITTLDRARSMRDIFVIALPAELQLQIFYMTVRESNTIQLAQVAHYVQQWTEPWIYEEVILYPQRSPKSARFMKTLAARPELGLFVRSLALREWHERTSPRLSDIIFACPGIIRFAAHSCNWNVNSSVWALATPFHPRNVTLTGYHNFTSLLSNVSSLSQVTHLFIETISREITTLLPQLPNLTHFAHRGESASTHYWVVIRGILAGCPKLEILWIVMEQCRGPSLQETVIAAGDTRVVLREGNDVLESLRKGELGLWDEVEEIALKQRASGVVSPWVPPVDSSESVNFRLVELFDGFSVLGLDVEGTRSLHEYAIA